MIELTPEQQELVEKLLAQALEVDTDARLALVESSGAEPAVLDEVKSLLGFQHAAFGEMDTPVVTPGAVVDVVDALNERDPCSSIPPPERIGPYRLLQKLGEGGMGTVYLAEQEKPLRRRVAYRCCTAV